MGRVKRIWYLSPLRAAKVQASLRIRAVSPEPSLLAHTSSESRGTFRQKARSLAPLNGWACAVKMCHDGMLEDTNSLDAAEMIFPLVCYHSWTQRSCRVHTTASVVKLKRKYTLEMYARDDNDQNEPPHYKNNKLACAPSKDSYQPGHPHKA